MFSQWVNEVMDGLLLGDGGLLDGPWPTFSMTQAARRKDWLELVQAIFHSEGIPSRVYPFTYSGRLGYGLITPCLEQLKPFMDRFYPSGRKVVPRDITLTPACVLFWYIGDGSLAYGRGVCPQVNFATHSFERGESEFLGELIRGVSGVSYSVVPTGSQCSKYFRLNLLGGKNGLERFFSYINLPDLIPKSYWYKFRGFLFPLDCADDLKVSEIFRKVV